MSTAEAPETKPAALVMVARPAIAPEQSPRTDGLPRCSFSTNAQESVAAAAPRVVVRKA